MKSMLNPLMQILLLAVCLYPFELHSQEIKFHQDKKRYFIEEHGKSLTKPIYDDILHDEFMEVCYVTRLANGFGLIGVRGGKALELLPTEYEDIRSIDYFKFIVRRNGKYALYEVRDNMDWDDDYKPFLKSKTPVFESDFIYDKGQHISLKSRLFEENNNEWKTWNYVALWQNQEAYVTDCAVWREPEHQQKLKCDEVSLTNSHAVVMLKFKLNGKFGMADQNSLVQVAAEYDSITQFRLLQNISDYSKDKMAYDYFVLYKSGKMFLTYFGRSTGYLIHSFQIDNYRIENNELFFTEKGKPMKMAEGKKIAADFELIRTDKFENKIIKKDGLYGLMFGDRMVLEPIYSDYEAPGYCSGIDYDQYFFKKDGFYNVISGKYRKFENVGEKIISVKCTDAGLFVQRDDRKWYSIYAWDFNNFGKAVIGYDSLVSMKYPSRGLLAYTGGKIHFHGSGSDYMEVNLPQGASEFMFIPETDGFIYKINGKFGYSNASTKFDAVLSNLKIGEDRKKRSTLFSTEVDGKEYLFYPEDFGTDNTIKTFVDCDVCGGNGYKLKTETSTEIIKGKTTVSSQRTFLWRDGQTIQTTTTVEPDQEVTTSETVHVDCNACSATGKTVVWIRNVKGTLVVR